MEPESGGDEGPQKQRGHVDTDTGHGQGRLRRAAYKTDAILTALSSYVSGQITPADGADPAAAGFDTPLVTVQVTTAEKTVTLRYASGMDGYYLMVEGDGSLYTVDQSTVQALLLPENAWKSE